MKKRVKLLLLATSLLTIISGCSNVGGKNVEDALSQNTSVDKETEIKDAESTVSTSVVKKDTPSSDIFNSEKISERTTRIFGKSGELMYLVEGTNKAVLIDTGSGDGNLKEYVEKLTNKPVAVLITHGHIDHASGASDFEEVYMNHADDLVYKEHVYDRLNGNAKPASDFKDLKEGDIFDLGGTTLEVYSAAGHTPGQMVILFKEDRILLLGDAANTFTYLDKNSFSIEDYAKSMKELLAKTEGFYDTVYVSHGSGDAPKEVLAGVIEVCEELLDGKAENMPYEFLGQQVLVAKRINAFFGRVDGGVGNIVYTMDKIPEAN